MTLSRSLVRANASVGTTPIDSRQALAAFMSRAAASAFGVRPGVLWGCTVTGTAGWNYSVAAGGLVTVRSTLQGAYPAAIDGATTVATTAAPASGSRIDIIYAVQRDIDAGDADNLAVLGCVQGVASGSPVAPSLPAGAVEIARNTMTSAATTTASAGNTISHANAPLTSLHGGLFEVPAFADLPRIVSPRAGDVAKVGSLVYVRDATDWRLGVRPVYVALVNFGATSGSAAYTQAVVFPSGLFSAAPVVVSSMQSGAAADMLGSSVNSVTTSGCNVRLFHTSGSTFATSGREVAIIAQSAG